MSIDRGAQERAAIVTGGGTGLGAAAARTLARQGVRVVVTGRRSDKLETVCAQIRADGGQALASVADLIAFLVGPSATPMAGAIIAVDGGYTAQ